MTEKYYFSFHDPQNQIIDPDLKCRCGESKFLQCCEWGYNTISQIFDKDVRFFCGNCGHTFEMQCDISVELVTIKVPKMKIMMHNSERMKGVEE